MNKKYKLLKSDTIQFLGRTLFRIQAKIAVGISVAKGDLGGYIEAESNLEVYGDAWVFGDAKVYGNACVSGDAKVYGNARVSGDAKVSGNACVYGDAKVYGDAWVYGDAKVYGDACVYGDAWVSGDAKVSKNCDYIVFKNNWSSGRYFTYTFSNKKWRVGCFYGTSAELIDKEARSSNKIKNYALFVELVQKMEIQRGTE
jgi:predicted acyltransferase (DUF342 family)